MAVIIPLTKKPGKALVATRAERATRADRPSILQTLDNDSLLGPFFSGPSWDGWRCVLRGVFGLPMTPADRAPTVMTIAQNVPRVLGLSGGIRMKTTR